MSLYSPSLVLFPSPFRLCAVGGDDFELKAHHWNISLALVIFHGILLINRFGAVLRCRWLARRRRTHTGP